MDMSEKPEDWRHDPDGEGLPQRLGDGARLMARHLREGRPGDALDIVDALIAELQGWRDTLSEQVNDDDGGLP
ncbi:hypothetical protein BAY61_10255 [Prauserella marina]|uniref:Uncharacterized protein n=2 Tax=Prauserella marina TaxID=530584 RepID=A0A222VNH8_9PSEU|nr:hypothetical protein BAY61_10255 [Prauserella marina]PWV84904.1 hypothetical protein DES30_101923 [Prauserella marina]SDC09902.1 hypothetical protein SAMN05421630_101414 [Prauserella marina]